MTPSEKLLRIKCRREGVIPRASDARILNVLTMIAAALLAVMVWALAVDGGRVSPLSWIFNDSQAAESHMGMVKHADGKVLGTEETVPEEAKPKKTEEETEDEATSPASTPGDPGSSGSPSDQ